MHHTTSCTGCSGTTQVPTTVDSDMCRTVVAARTCRPLQEPRKIKQKIAAA